MNPRNKKYPKVLQLYVTDEQHAKLKAHARTKNFVMADVLRDYIDSLPEPKSKRRVVRRTK